MRLGNSWSGETGYPWFFNSLQICVAKHGGIFNSLQICVAKHGGIYGKCYPTEMGL